MNPYGIKAFFNARQDGDTHAKSMFSGIDGDTAENIIADLPSFLSAAGRDYGILRTPAFVRDPFGGVDENGKVCEAIREVDNQFHLTRTSDGCVVSPHTVTKQYAPFSLVDLAEEIQPWCNAGWCTPDAVYSGKNESLELLTLRLDASGELPNGEEWDHHIVFRLPHAAGGKAKGTIVSYRRKCSNTFGAVGRGTEFVIGHRISANMTDEERQEAMAQRARDAVAAWKTAQKYIENLSDRINRWSGAACTFEQATTLTDRLLGISDLEKASKRKQNTRKAILDGFSMPQYGTIGQSLFDWLNGITFYLSSPHCLANQKSKVDPIDRMIRNISPTESGWKMEADAERLAQLFVDGKI